MKCAICLMIKTGVAFDAVTVRGGTAVCEDHMDNAFDENVQNAYRRLPVEGGVVKYQTDKDFEERD